MRVTSLILLIAIVGGAGYVFFFTDWITKGKRTALGFTPAKSPAEAAEKFAKAVKARDLKTAATYCTKDYADLLIKAADANAEVGATVDRIAEYMKNKGWRTDKSVAILHYFDPFPPQLVPGPASKGDGKAAEVAFTIENPGFDAPVTPPLLAEVAKGLHPALFLRCLVPVSIAPNPFVNGGTVAAVKEGENWKLSIPVPADQQAAVIAYLNNYKSLRTGLDSFRQDLVNESRTIGTKAEFESAINRALSESK